MSNEDALRERDDQRHGVYTAADKAGTCTCGHPADAHGVSNVTPSTNCREPGCGCANYSAVMVPIKERMRILTIPPCWCGHAESEHSVIGSIPAGCKRTQHPDSCRCVRYGPPTTAGAAGGWTCPKHGGYKIVPAGISKNTGKPYPRFRACGHKPARGEPFCDEKEPFQTPRATNSAAKVAAAANTLVQVAAAKPSQCRVFEPGGGNAFGQGHCITCGQGFQPDHAQPIETRVARSRGGSGVGHNPIRQVATLTHVEHRPPNERVLGYGWEAGKPGIPAVVQIDEIAAAALRMMLHDHAWGGKVSVWVEDEDWVVSDRLGDDVVQHMDNTVKPATYTGATIGVPGRKPTLTEAQSVLILRTYQGTVPGDPLVQCDVVYDPTDAYAKACEWKPGTLITGVAHNDLNERKVQA